MAWVRRVAKDAVNPSSSNALCEPSRAFFLAALLLVTSLALSACGRFRPAVSQPLDDYEVTLSTEPLRPSQGEGFVIVVIKDRTGRPVEDASLTIEANMSHAGMVPVFAAAAGGQAGVYRVPLHWTMGGAWYVDVSISLSNGKAIRRRFQVDVE